MSKLPGKTETIENFESPAFDPSAATEQVRAVVDHGLEQSKQALSKLSSDAETT